MNTNQPQTMPPKQWKFDAQSTCDRQCEVYEVGTELIDNGLLKGALPPSKFQLNCGCSVVFRGISVEVYLVIEEPNLVPLPPIPSTAESAAYRLKKG
jgi:hypothetical protein